MGTIVEQKNFQERMIDRIRDSIGELMTDEELSKIVHRAMEEIFFKPMELKMGYQTKEVPPFIHQLLKELLADAVRNEVTKYIAENKLIVLKQIQQTISRGMGQALIDAISNRFHCNLMTLQDNLASTIRNE